VTPCVALAPSAYSNKLFGYLGYTWDEEESPSPCWIPHVGIGGMYEHGQTNHAANQWGLYIKGGIIF